MPMLSHGLQKLFMVSVRNKAGAVFGSGGEGEKFFSFTGGADRFVMAESFADEVFSRFWALRLSVLCFPPGMKTASYRTESAVRKVADAFSSVPFSP